MRRKRQFGWKPDVEDTRDWRLGAPSDADAMALPGRVDLIPQCAPIQNQGTTNSCTAHVVCRAHHHVQRRMSRSDWVPSRLFTYYCGRIIDLETWPGQIEDNGLTIRAGIKSLVKDGVCPESLWRFSKSAVNRKPSQTAYANAQRHQAVGYWRVQQTEVGIKSALAQGYPVCLGVMVYESFMSDDVERTGNIPMPDTGREPFEGAHAVLIVGYDNDHAYVQNSWGTGWGDRGYGTIPLAYLVNANLCSDLWTLRLIER